MKVNVESVKSVANANETSRSVFEEFGGRQRFRKSTNLIVLRRALISKGAKVVNEDFMNTFKTLAASGIGSLSKRGDHFQWFYNLKDVAQAALGATELPPRQIAVSVDKGAITKRGRPKGSKTNPMHVTKKGAYIQILIPGSMLRKLKNL